jgi:hypothetical protein
VVYSENLEVALVLFQKDLDDLKRVSDGFQNLKNYDQDDLRILKSKEKIKENKQSL